MGRFDLLLAKGIVLEGLGRILCVDCISEDIVKSKLPWKDVLQEMRTPVYLFIIPEAVQYICHMSDMSIIGEFVGRTDVWETKICSSIRIQVRLSVQDTVSHKSDRVESVDLMPGMTINLGGIRDHQSCTTIWLSTTRGVVLVNGLKFRETDATDLHKVVSSTLKRHEHPTILQKLDKCDNTVSTDQFRQAGPSISL